MDLQIVVWMARSNHASRLFSPSREGRCERWPRIVIQCTRLNGVHVLDLWQLPADRLTDPLTDELEREFYRRCPPEKRPGSWRKSNSDVQTRPPSVVTTSSATVEDEKRAPASKPDQVQEKGDIDLEKAAGSLPDDDEKRSTKQKVSNKDESPKYDESLIKALNQCYFWLWWAAGILTLLGSA